MMKPAACVFTLSLLGIGPIASHGAQTIQARDIPSFRAGVEAVYLDVVVTGPSHPFLPELTADDFAVYEDGVQQQVTFFSRNDVTGLTFVLLLDASTSIGGSERAIRKASDNLVRGMTPRDEAAVVVFSDEILTSTPFTRFSKPLQKAIKSLYPNGSTALYDAVMHALDKLAPTDGRKSLIVFTDGTDSSPMKGGSKSSAGEVVAAAKLSEVTIYTVGFIANGSGVNASFLETLAGETGGRAFFPANAEHLSRSFASIEQELHTSYSVAYVPSKKIQDAQWRQVEVKLPRYDTMIARTRSGYYAIPRTHR